MVDLPFPLRIIVLGATCAALSLPALANNDSKFKVSGFLSAVGGRLIDGELSPNYAGPDTIDGKICPCYTADWNYAGVYTDDFSFEPESRAGIQIKYTVSEQINLVTQIVMRGTDPKPDVQWAYASYAPNRTWEFQAGRKRIPLYFYSDYQDVGVTYPWVGVPPELYGWEVTNYNGASVRYKGAVGDANVSASMFAGREKLADSLYQRLYYEGPTETTWGSLVGGDVEMTRGPLTVRAVYMQAKVRAVNPIEDLDDRADLNAYGVAANLDMDDWFVLAEVSQLARDFEIGYTVKAPAMSLGAGYRFGSWTPFINYARYKEISSDQDIYLPQSFNRASLTLRYDINARSAAKIQLDRASDVTDNFGGDVTVFRIAYDRLF